MGDGTNFVLIFVGALLEHAEELLRMGLSPSEVIEGYKMASKKALNILPSNGQARWWLHVSLIISSFPFRS